MGKKTNKIKTLKEIVTMNLFEGDDYDVNDKYLRLFDYNHCPMVMI